LFFRILFFENAAQYCCVNNTLILLFCNRIWNFWFFFRKSWYLYLTANCFDFFFFFSRKILELISKLLKIEFVFVSSLSLVKNLLSKLLYFLFNSFRKLITIKSFLVAIVLFSAIVIFVANLFLLKQIVFLNF